MDEIRDTDYSEILLPGALEQNPGVSWPSMILSLWLLVYGQEKGPKEENGMAMEVGMKRSTQELNIVIIYIFHHINNLSCHSCVSRLLS